MLVFVVVAVALAVAGVVVVVEVAVVDVGIVRHEVDLAVGRHHAYQLIKFNSRRKVNKQPINFYVYYEADDQEAAHALSLDNYHRKG